VIPEAVLEALERVGRRHRRISRLALAVQSLIAGWGAAAAAYVLYALAWGRPPVWIAPAAFAAGALVSFFRALRPPMDPLGVARLIDARLDLKDRLATALEWGGRRSPLVYWLMEDAAQHARFVKPEAVVPWPGLSRVHRLGLAAAAVLSVLAWAGPLPDGLLVRPAPPAADAVDPEYEELLDQVIALREAIAAIPTPEMRRLDRDLSQLQAGLRDRSFPQDEALALLRHFERRVQAALAGLSGIDSAADPLDLEQLQELAKRLELVALVREEASPGDAGSVPPLAGRAASPDELPQGLLDALLRSSGDARPQPGAMPEGAGGADPAGDAAEGGAFAVADVPEDGAALPSPGAVEGPAGPASQDSGGERDGAQVSLPGGPGEPGGSSGTGGGPSPAGDRGSGGQDGTFEAGQGVRIVDHVTGQLGDGPLHIGRVNTALPAPSQAAEVPRLSGPLASGAGGFSEHGVGRENVPLVYRDAVRNYFRSLEPGEEP